MKFKVGDKVLCISNKAEYGVNPTIGKVYTVDDKSRYTEHLNTRFPVKESTYVFDIIDFVEANEITETLFGVIDEDN